MKALKIITFIILLVGIAGYLHSFSIPKFTDEKAREKLISDTYNLIEKGEKYDSKKVFGTEAKLRTNKLLFEDTGSGLVIFSFIILLLLFVLKLDKSDDLQKIKSPKRYLIYILSNIAIILNILGIFWYFTYRQHRGDYLPFADSISIPIFSSVGIYMILMILWNLFLIITLWGIKGQTPIFIKPTKYNGKLIFLEIFFDIIIFVFLYSLYYLIIDGDITAIPINIFFIYILLSIRASRINKILTNNYAT